VEEYALKTQIARNTVIRNGLNIFNLNNRIQNNRLNWVHHFERTEPKCIPEQLTKCVIFGEMRIGRGNPDTGRKRASVPLFQNKYHIT
jgi:hypothetical protein